MTESPDQFFFLNTCFRSKTSTLLILKSLSLLFSLYLAPLRTPRTVLCSMNCRAIARCDNTLRQWSWNWCTSSCLILLKEIVHQTFSLNYTVQSVHFCTHGVVCFDVAELISCVGSAFRLELAQLRLGCYLTRRFGSVFVFICNLPPKINEVYLSLTLTAGYGAHYHHGWKL